MKRMTWIGIGPCGCAQLVAADPEYVLNHLVGTLNAARKTMKKVERLEMDLEEYKSLLDNLRPYAERGQIKLVDDDHLGLYIEQMKTCRCRQGDVDDATTEARPAPNHRDLAHEIVTFLRERNGAELRDTFDDMKVRDLRLLLDELALILQHGGRPPNWDPR